MNHTGPLRSIQIQEHIEPSDLLDEAVPRPIGPIIGNPRGLSPLAEPAAICCRKCFRALHVPPSYRQVELVICDICLALDQANAAAAPDQKPRW